MPMVPLLAKAGALGCHFKAFPAINQRLSSPPARAPAARAANPPSSKAEQWSHHDGRNTTL